MQFRRERVRVETQRHIIEGTLQLPNEGYRSRTTDFLNAHDSDFIALTDADVEWSDSSHGAEHHEFLAVSARHPFARSESVSLEDLARDKVLRPRSFPGYLDESLVPPKTPGGRPIERGHEFSTVQEMLSLIGAGQGMFPVPEHAARFDTRPDIAYVPIRDGLPRERRFIWRTTTETHRIRAFTRVARDVVARSPNPLQG